MRDDSLEDEQNHMQPIYEDKPQPDHHARDNSSPINPPMPVYRRKTSSEDSGRSPMYRNNLLAAIGFLDLANALDFPANVWNKQPLPLFAKILMGLGGSIAILSSSFAIWDLMRSRQNVKILRKERAHLQQRRSEEKTLTALEIAWLGINYRELGWEIIDRMLLDIFMAIAGVMVGTGCLMATKGDVPAVFLASNILSGYLGNSFVAFYALINASWSVYMWRRAHMNEIAVAKAKGSIDGTTFMLLQKHARSHKLYAVVNGLSLLVSGIGSEICSTLWPGYVVLIPCIFGSVFCNYYWRYCLGYDRASFQDRLCVKKGNLAEYLNMIIRSRTKFTRTSLIITCDHGGYYEAMNSFVHDFGQDLTSDKAQMAKDKKRRPTLNEEFDRIDDRRIRSEERFILELFGYYLLQVRQVEADQESSS